MKYNIMYFQELFCASKRNLDKNLKTICTQISTMEYICFKEKNIQINFQG